MMLCERPHWRRALSRSRTLTLARGRPLVVLADTRVCDTQWETVSAQSRMICTARQRDYNLRRGNYFPVVSTEPPVACRKIMSRLIAFDWPESFSAAAGTGCRSLQHLLHIYLYMYVFF